MRQGIGHERIELRGTGCGASGRHARLASLAPIAALLGSAPSFAWAGGTPPANDECAGARTLVEAVALVATTTDATPSADAPDESVCPGTFLEWNASPDVWFRYLAPGPGFLAFTTCDPSGFDTSIAVYEGDCGQSVLRACNGDAPDDSGCQSFHAEVRNLRVAAGETSLLRVGGYDGGTGSTSVAVHRSELAAWGSNATGLWSTPAGALAIDAVRGGGDFALARRADGSLVAWGLDDAGQCAVPADLGAVSAFDAGSRHAVAIGAGGVVRCWGANDLGQSTPPAKLGPATLCAAGGGHTLVVTAKGAVVGFGANRFGQIVPPKGLSAPLALAAGEGHSMALRADGSVVCWGENGSDQCEPPPDLTGATRIAAGRFHSLALRGDGTVAAWGFNDFGQTAVPAGIADAIAIDAGAFFSVVLRADGSVVTFGENGAGQCNVPDAIGAIDLVAATDFTSLAHAAACGGDASADCDGDGVPDACAIAAGAEDLDGNGIPDGCEGVPYDLDGDGFVSGPDLSIFLSEFGIVGASPEDFDGDGAVLGSDLALLLGNWNPPPKP